MKGLKKKLIFLTLAIIFPLSIQPSKIFAGSFGAEIFCTMRDGGNDHESSWDAAYTYIKKQKGGIFKVSPKQAASQITESVIREKEKFSYCVEYLDNLHPNRKLQRELEIKQKDIEYKDRDHALFVAFAPYKDPKYAISVVVEHGGTGSGSAAPIAKKIIKKVLERDQLRENIKNLTGEEI